MIMLPIFASFDIFACIADYATLDAPALRYEVYTHTDKANTRLRRCFDVITPAVTPAPCYYYFRRFLLLILFSTCLMFRFSCFAGRQDMPFLIFRHYDCAMLMTAFTHVLPFRFRC